jgi:hypothetical protein
MRTFIDTHGTEWTVFEVKRSVVGPSGRVSFLPDGLSHGWLCFESELGKRRLPRFPSNWRQFTDRELETLVRAATPARNSRYGEVDSRDARDTSDGRAH